MSSTEQEVKLVIEAIESANGEVREYARNVLFSLGYERSLAPLRHILFDKSYSNNLRAWSAHALGQLQDKNSLEVLTQILSDKSESSIVRGGAAKGLGKLTDQRADEILVKAIQEEEVAEINRSILEVLTERNTDFTLKAIIDFVANNNKESLVMLAIELLMRCQQNNEVFDVLNSLAKDKDRGFSRDAINFFEEILFWRPQFNNEQRMDLLTDELLDEDMPQSKRSLILLYLAELKKASC